MNIDTGDAPPRRQPVRRTPFAVRTEIARQLREMQSQGVIEPSSRPWASPVVLVRKKDGSLRFCIDYRHLNLVTKPDVFPLPRMDDLLDQLGQFKFFSTLDLASGYWQVKMHPDSREKTAFITHQGLYELKVMPFGLRNAPAVFQRLMQCVLAGVNPPEGPYFVSVYLDDVIVFSRTLDDHLHHLSLVIDRLAKAGLKLKPSNCHFISKKVQYLGHLLTPDGIRPNPDRVAAVRDYSAPTSVKEARQFLGHNYYASRSLSPQGKRYAITELETLAVVWSVSHFHAYLYGHDVHVFTDHSAVKAILETPSPSGKHARWWSKLFGSGVRNVQITYRAGRENANADALSRCPVGGETADTSVPDVQVAQIQTAGDITELLQIPPSVSDTAVHYSQEQEKDPEILGLTNFLSQGQLPDDSASEKDCLSSSFVRAHRRHRLLHRLETKPSATLCCSHTYSSPYGG